MLCVRIWNQWVSELECKDKRNVKGKAKVRNENHFRRNLKKFFLNDVLNDRWREREREREKWKEFDIWEREREREREAKEKEKKKWNPTQKRPQRKKRPKLLGQSFIQFVKSHSHRNNKHWFRTIPLQLNSCVRNWNIQGKHCGNRINSAGQTQPV